jgi:outer membrane protein assembly factor BamA
MAYKYKKISYIFLLLALLLTYFFLPVKANAVNPNKNYSIDIKSETISKTILKEWKKELEIRPISSEVKLNYFYYRFQQDQSLLKKLLESEGYYQANIKAHFDENNHHSSYIINAGNQYVFGQIEIVINGVSIKGNGIRLNDMLR